MKLKYKFLVRNVAGQAVALAPGEDSKNFNGMIKLNETGEFIFKLLENDTTVDEIVDAILKQYNTSAEEAKEAVNGYLDILRKHNLLDE